MLDNVQDKSPADKYGETPLHEAARHGRLEIYRLMMEYVQDKNPADNNGTTPLHEAAEGGHLEICHHILENVQDAYPVDQEGVESPLDIASRRGHAKVCQLFKKHLRQKQKQKKSTNTKSG